MCIKVPDHYGFAGNVEGCEIGLVVRGAIYSVDCKAVSFLPHVNLHYFTFDSELPISFTILNSAQRALLTPINMPLATCFYFGRL
jgi:hypothetical protein